MRTFAVLLMVTIVLIVAGGFSNVVTTVLSIMLLLAVSVRSEGQGNADGKSRSQRTDSPAPAPRKPDKSRQSAPRESRRQRQSAPRESGQRESGQRGRARPPLQPSSLAGYGAGLLGWSGLCVVPADHVGIVHRRFGPAAPDQRFKRITPHNARGIQAATLLPGRRYWLNPLSHRVDFIPRIHIPAGQIGLVSATEGAKRDPGRALGRYVECDDFQDGAAFLMNGGEQGRQLAFLRGDTSYYINTSLFQVELVPRTYVEPGTVGLVVAKDGAVRPPNRPFGRYVECDNFQNGPAFLMNGGEQGKQLAILAGGTSYDINPYLFEVITKANVGATDHGGLRAEHLREVSIPVGHIGVVITLDGGEPERGDRKVGPITKGHSNFRLPWVFLANGGWRGVQEETVGEGSVYALNPWFVRVVLIPTRLLTLEWSKKDNSEQDNYDAKLDRISVNVQGHRLEVELKQTLNIPETAAPRLVSEFGESSMTGVGGLVDNHAPVQRFVERVLGGAVDTYFNGIAAESSVDYFFTQYSSIRTDLADQVRQALQAWGVKATSTTLGEFEAQNAELDTLRSRVPAEDIRRAELIRRKENAGIEATIREREIDVERQEQLLKVAELERRIEVLGRDAVAMQMFLAELKDMKVPEVVSGNAETLLNLPFQRAMDLIERVQRGAERTALEKQPAPDGDDTEPDGAQA